MSIPLRVLFIGDSEVDTQVILQELCQGNYQPIHQRVNDAATMQIALQHSWDIIICDYSLCCFSAPAALQTLKTMGLDLPFIVLSSVTGEEIAVAMMRAGASDYLFKVHLNRLLPAIARELQAAEIRRVKRQAEASVLQLAAIVESSEDAIISTDLQGRVLTWNLGAEKLYGYAAAAVKGQLLAPLIQPDGHSLLVFPELAVPAVVPAVAVPAEVVPAEVVPAVAVPTESQEIKLIDCHLVTQQRQTGELIEVLLTVSLIKHSGSVVGFAVIARDINERQMIQRLQDEFISLINHELRTPLTSLQGSVELLLTGKLGELSERGARLLNIAANNIDRLVQITNNILDLEALSSGEIVISKQHCDIGELVQRAVNDMQPLALSRGVRLLMTPQLSQISSVQISLDAVRITQVLHHLINNAIQFSQPGGRVWLDLVKAEELVDLIKQPCIVVKIRDEGQGIPSDKIEIIFEQFQQVDASNTRRSSGAGLGLAISRSIVQQHQGRLWAESTLGQGSTFYLALPMQRVTVQAQSGNT